MFESVQMCISNFMCELVDEQMGEMLAEMEADLESGVWWEGGFILVAPLLLALLLFPLLLLMPTLLRLLTLLRAVPRQVSWTMRR